MSKDHFERHACEFKNEDECAEELDGEVDFDEAEKEFYGTE